jgi:CRP-like cAMP-binding protein
VKEVKEEMDVDPTLSVFEKILQLRRRRPSGVSNTLSAGQLSVVADEMREHFFKSGSVLMREGEAPIAAYSLVRGRVRVSRRGHVLGEVGSGAAVGIGGIVSRDALGLGAVATTDVLALELDRETLVDIFEDLFPLLLQAIREASGRHLDLIRRMKQVPEEPVIHPEPFLSGPLDFVERILFSKTPGGPFEHSSIDALAEIAQRAQYRSIEPGTTLWREGERAGHACVVVNGTILCSSSRDDGPVQFRARRGMAIGALESIAGQPRWHDAVADTRAEMLEHDVDDLFDVFEDNVEMAMDFLAWVASDELNLIETTFGPGPELLDFFTGSSD